MNSNFTRISKMACSLSSGPAHLCACAGGFPRYAWEKCFFQVGVVLNFSLHGPGLYNLLSLLGPKLWDQLFSAKFYKKESFSNHPLSRPPHTYMFSYLDKPGPGKASIHCPASWKNYTLGSYQKLVLSAQIGSWALKMRAEHSAK